MNITKVKIKEFKKLKKVEFDFNGQHILLIGDNGVGKSSVIQIINIALGNNTNIPPNATGEGEVIVDKDGNKYIFHVKFKDGKPHLTVTAPDGLKDTRKSAIAQIVGAIDFNPDEFVKLSDTTAGRKKQVDIYKSFLPKEVIEVIEGLERKAQASYDERTEVNRKAKTLEGFIKESPLYGEEVSIEVVDVSGLNEKIQEATKANEKITGVASGIEERKRKVASNNDRLIALKAEMKALEEETDKVTGEITSGELWLLKNPKIDTSDLYAQVNSASETNQRVELAKEHKSKLAQFEKFNEEAGELTVLIETSKQAIADAIRDMNTPVEGLRFDAEQLIYNDVPVSTASLSTSEIMHLGAKMKMAQNPEFGVLFVDNAESLGTERFNDIMEMAAKYGWQVIGAEVERGTKELRVEFITE